MDANLWGVTPHEARLLQQLEATYPRLDAWFARTSTRIEQPQVQSELAADDALFPHAPISEIARHSLACCVEHLRMVRVTIDARQLFPSGSFTTLRGALVGAAQAVWVLGPDDPAVRRERGLAVVAEEYEQLAKFYREVDRLDPGTVPPDQWDWLRSRINGVAQVRIRQTDLNQTEMIATALDESFPHSSDKRRSGRLMWRQMSGDAHVLGWAVAQRSSVHRRPNKGESLAALAAPGTLELTAEPFLCAFELARRGWSLFDRRCEAP